MIKTLAWLEIGGKAAPDPSCVAAMTQQGTADECEVTTRPDHTFVGVTWNNQRGRIKPQELFNERRRRSDLITGELFVGQTK
jgi:hypothetical protein